jgi:hypothetical protein
LNNDSIIAYVETAGTLRMEEEGAFGTWVFTNRQGVDISRDLSVLQHRISTKNSAQKIGYLKCIERSCRLQGLTVTTKNFQGKLSL